jgi:hypothetical protein
MPLDYEAWFLESASCKDSAPDKTGSASERVRGTT